MSDTPRVWSTHADGSAAVRESAIVGVDDVVLYNAWGGRFDLGRASADAILRGLLARAAAAGRLAEVMPPRVQVITAEQVEVIRRGVETLEECSWGCAADCHAAALRKLAAGMGTGGKETTT